jgi:archaellum biogenesis ATPase FlaH
MCEGELVMIHGWRGVGKTYFAGALSVALATGSSFLKATWKAPRPRNVLYIDGELSGRLLVERFSSLIAGLDASAAEKVFEVFERLHVLSFEDWQGWFNRGMRLSEPEDQQWLKNRIKRLGIEVVVLDSLTTLGGVDKENDAESWAPVQRYLLELRALGLVVILLHHDNKMGTQRGTSRREDVLDLVLQLKRPPDYQTSQGLRAILEFSKVRSAPPEECESIEVTLEGDPPIFVWRRLPGPLERVAEMTKEGLGTKDIAGELGVSRWTVQRLKKQAKECGLLE